MSRRRLPDRALEAIKPAVMLAQSLVVRVTRGITLGVRGLVTDESGGVLLVRHSYVPGWYLPGGAVEPGETALASLDRELEEEAGVKVEGDARLVGVYFNEKMARRDHVVVYHVPAWRRIRAFVPNAEIVACGFFPAGDLPPDATDATRRRVGEALHGAAVSPMW